MIFVTDLEGVLIPEIWVEIADKIGIPELRLTTHDVENFETLMAGRIRALAGHGVVLGDIVRIAGNVLPFSGSIEFLSWLRTKGPILIVSDTFTELANGIATRLGGYPLFANCFETDPAGKIIGYQLRIRGQKDRLVSALSGIGYRMTAIGDGFNDLSMLKIAHHPVLFRPAPELAKKVPGAPVVNDYVELKREIEKIIETRES